MRQSWFGIAALAAALAVCGCRCEPPAPNVGDGGTSDAGGDVDAGGTDAGGTDAGGTDAGGTDGGGTDAGRADGGAALRPSSEVVSGGGRLTGGTKVMDVQVGHPVSQSRTSGGTRTLEGNAAVKP